MAGSFPPWALRVGDARGLAAIMLAGQPERWRHTVGVAHRAEELAATIGADDPVLLVAAAWLHDIGYADRARETGFHPIDGARYLSRGGWPDRLCALVAHHSGARFLADHYGLAESLDRFGREESPLADALTYADQTVGQDGQSMSVQARIEDMLERHGPGSINVRAHHLRGPHLLAVAQRVRGRLSRRGVGVDLAGR